MSDLFGCLTDEFGGADEALALASYANGTSSYGLIGRHASHPLLKRSRVYYQERTEKNGNIVGLDNQGATCYLNSLLQSLYLTPEFRQLLYDLSEEELGLEHYLAHEAKEAETKAAFERMSEAEKLAFKESQKAVAEPSEEMIAEFTGMGMDRTNVIRTLKKFPDPSQKEAALDYLFTHVFELDPPDTTASSSSSKPAPRLYKRIPIEFRRFFAHLQLGSQAVIGTEGITKSFGWDSKEGQASVQHDIQELYIRLMEALSGSLKDTQAEKTMNGLYQGSILTRTTCSVCGLVSDRSEAVYNFHAHVKGMTNLRTSLQNLVKPEKLEGNNKYHCSGCKAKVNAWRQDTLQVLPPLLTIALNRHEYNKKNWQRVKVNDRLPFPFRLDMQPYQDEVAHKSREQLEIDAMEAAVAASSSGAKPVPADPQNDLDRAIAMSLKSTEEQAAEFATNALAEKESQQQNNGKGKGGNKGNNQKGGGKKNKCQKGASDGGADNAVELDIESGTPQIEPSVWNEDSPHLYDLFSVVVHSGGAHGGHYFAYIKDVVGQANYFAANPQARLDYDTFLRSPTGANSYSGDGTRSKHPSFWYECNDSSISSISFDKVASQYGGRKTCAYILMYRQLNLQSNPCSYGAGPTVPIALQEQLARFNSQLTEERLIYDQISNEIEIELHLPSEFDVYEGQLIPRGYDPRLVEEEEAKEEAKRKENRAQDEQTDVLEGFAMMGVSTEESAEEANFSKEKGKDSTAAKVIPIETPLATTTSSTAVTPAAIPTPPPRLVINQRITVPELHAKLVEYFAASPELLSSCELTSEDSIVINQLSIKLKPPHQVEGYLSLDDPLDSETNQGQPQQQTNQKKKKGNKRPNPKSLEQLGFGTVQQLLIWNGRTINGKPFATGTKKDQVLNLKCCWFANEAAPAAAESTTAQPTEFFLTVSPTTTLLQLGTLLSERTSIPFESITIYAMHPVSKAIKFLDLSHADDLPKPLRVLGVMNQGIVGIEARPTGKKAFSHVQDYFNSLQQSVKLVILNPLPGAALSQFELDVSKSSTVAQLKQTVFDHIHPHHPSLTLDAFRLRKVSGLSKLGALLTSDQQTLKQADLLEDDMRVTIELGTQPNEQELDLLVTILSNISVPSEQAGVEKLALAKVLDRAPTIVQKSWTIKQLKQALLDRFGLGHRAESSYALYRGHATYEEHDKPFTNEFMTLAQINLQQSDWVWLEEGEIPASGKIQIEVALILPNTNQNEVTSSVPSPDGSSSSSSTPPTKPTAELNVSPAEWHALQQPIPTYEPLPSPQPVAPLTAVVEPVVDESKIPDSTTSVAAVAATPSTISQVFIPPPASYLLTPLFHLDFSSLDTLLELKQVLHAYPSVLNSALTPSHLRVRMVNRNDTLGRVLIADDKTLKKQQFSADKKIGVQILSQEDGLEFGLSAGALLLKYCLAVPRVGGGVSVGPPQLHEFMFDDGEYPQYGALQSALAKRCGIPDSDKQDVAILKWIGVSLQNKDQQEKDQKAANDSKKDSSTSTPPAASAAAPSPALSKGWITLFPNGPDPSEPIAKGDNKGQNNQKGQNQPKQKQQNQGKQQGGKGQPNNKGKGGGNNIVVPPKVEAPAWCLKFGSFGLHDEDILMVVRLSEFGCASLAELSTLVRAWGLTVAPPGYILVEKDRAEEYERRAQQERERKAAPKRKEIELKIEY